MRFEELNWMDVENYLKHDDRLLLVLGSCEQHAYLSLLRPMSICPWPWQMLPARCSGVLVAPPFNFGSFALFPGLPRHAQFACEHAAGCGGRPGALGLRAWFPAHPGAQWARRQRAGQEAACTSWLGELPGLRLPGMPGGFRTASMRLPGNTNSNPAMPTGWKPLLSTGSPACP